MRAADRLRPGLADAEMAYLALAHEIAHRTDRVLDRHIRVDPVDVIKIDDFGLEPLQAAVAAGPEGFWAAVREPSATGHAQIAEFAGDHVIVAAAGDRFCDQFLVAPAAVSVRGVEEID